MHAHRDPKTVSSISFALLPLTAALTGGCFSLSGLIDEVTEVGMEFDDVFCGPLSGDPNIDTYPGQAYLADLGICCPAGSTYHDEDQTCRIAGAVICDGPRFEQTCCEFGKTKDADGNCR